MARTTALPAVTEESPLLAWLLVTLAPMSRTRVKELLARGSISVNGTSVTQFNHPLKPGDRVGLGPPPPRDRSLAQANLNIIHEDADVIVLDKPAGLLTVATEAEKTDTAFARLSAHLTARDAGRPYVVHRLDRETSGLLLFARSAGLRDRLQDDWGELTKTYLVVVQGQPQSPAGKIDNFLVEGTDFRVRICERTTPQAKQAISKYRVVKTRGKFSLIEVTLVTGRKHQIRVHMHSLRCPVIGDPLYGKAENPAGRLGLHSTKLVFPHPITGETLRLESPLPPELRRVVGD